MKVAIPRAYLGTMTFGWSQTSAYVGEVEAEKMVRKFIEFDNEIYDDSSSTTPHYIDTARIYAGGKTEKILGQVLKKVDASSLLIKVGTKAAPSVQPGGLSPDGIQQQYLASMDAVGLDSSGCDEYYLHQPDTEHSLLESLKSADSLLKDGKITTIGMSNYHASEMARAFDLCREHNLTPPTVYQGLYNPLNRLVEEELLPVLRQNGCSFIAYNPLAAGLLTGKHKDIDNVAKGRFKENQNYLPRFYTPSNFEALRLIQAECDRYSISMVQATFRWLLCHSALDPASDGFLLGASSVKQLEQNLDACRAAANSSDPLPSSLLEAFDKGWELTKEDSFKYWRSYSSDMPNRDSLDQGASYSANKTKK